jgi:UDPglucose 6-dehydrogenase
MKSLLGETPRQIAVIGSGYVGLTTAACLAHLGHEVHCTDIVSEKVAALNAGQVPILEEGLPRLVREGLKGGRLSFGTDNVSAAGHADFVFLCLPTPPGPGGRADLSHVVDAVREIARHLRPGTIVVGKSTVPVGSSRMVAEALGRRDVFVVSNPEFLREGSAVADFLNPERVVVGADSGEVAMRVASLYSQLGARIIVTDPESAELAKYACNAFLATKLSFINSLAELCERVGGDARQVARVMGHDSRIGSKFLEPGPGWGGSCFPKDTLALLRISQDAGYDFPLLRTAVTSNEEQFDRVVQRIERIAGGPIAGKIVTVWGLTFKAETDDMRSSPSLEVIARLERRGAVVQAYDPTVHPATADDKFFVDPYSACQASSVIFVGTEWAEFGDIDFERAASHMVDRNIVDSRSIVNAEAAVGAGFTLARIGLADVAPQFSAAAVCG